MALCANGVFYSNHSYFNSFSNESETPKAALATKFLEQANRMLPSMFANEMELVDSIRAMLMIVDVYVCLGKQDEAATVNSNDTLTSQDAKLN